MRCGRCCILVRTLKIMRWLRTFSLYLAPMAGVTDAIFRVLCRELGADVVETEFVSAEGVLQAWQRTKRYVQITPGDRPVGVQLFGANPARMAQAARIIVDAVRPDFLDINAGCPVPKVVGRNGGASLLKDLPLLGEIARAVVAELRDDCPVTAKIRLGWDAQHICAQEACHRLEEAGVCSITIHGRTRAQQYGGTADWDMIHHCASLVRIPVIGNGDITTPQDVLRERDLKAVAGVMIGRAAMHDPWIFQRAKALLATGHLLPAPTVQERIQLMLRHVHLTLESGMYGDEACTMRTMRARILAYTKQIPGSKPHRAALARIGSYAELKELAAILLASPGRG